MTTYKNPWHTPGKDCYGPAMYETDAKPFEHAGCLIYERIPGKVWDVVKDGVCQTQRAGKRGAKEGAEIVSQGGYLHTQPRETDGTYSFELSRMCRCGHTLGQHLGAGPVSKRSCIAHECINGPAEECTCSGFKATKS